MRSYLIKVGCKAMMVSLWEQDSLDTDIQREKATWGQRQRLEWCCSKPRNSKDCRQPPEARREARNSFLSESPEGSNLPMPWFQTEKVKINICQFKPPNLWNFVTAVSGNQYSRFPSIGPSYYVHFPHLLNPKHHFVKIGSWSKVNKKASAEVITTVSANPAHQE